VARFRYYSAGLSSIASPSTGTGRPGRCTSPGAGLGLAIARWITDMHGGTIAAGSKLGAGSVFQVRLPAMASA